MLYTVLTEKIFSVTDRELSSNQEVKDSTLGEIMNVSSRVNQEGTSPGVTISQVSVNATVPVAGEILNSTVGAFEGMVKCKAVLHSQKRFGFTITVPLSEDRDSVQRLNSPFIQKKVKNGKAAQEGTSKSHKEPHGKWYLNLILFSFRVRFQLKVFSNLFGFLANTVTTGFLILTVLFCCRIR